jgi:hypothetical protein
LNRKHHQTIAIAIQQDWQKSENGLREIYGQTDISGFWLQQGEERERLSHPHNGSLNALEIFSSRIGYRKDRSHCPEDDESFVDDLFSNGKTVTIRD